MPFIIFTLPTLIHSWLSWFCCMAVAYQSSPQLMNSLVWFQQLRSGYFKLQRIVRARHLRFEISPASDSNCFNISVNGCAAEGRQICSLHTFQILSHFLFNNYQLVQDVRGRWLNTTLSVITQTITRVCRTTKHQTCVREWPGRQTATSSHRKPTFSTI